MSQNLKESTKQGAKLTVINLTRKTRLSADLQIADSPIDKFLGLLIKSNPRSLLFYTRFGMHTFFLKTPIDIIVLDITNIVRKTETVKPNRLFFYNPKYPHVLELARGTIERSGTKIGDKLGFSVNIN